MSPDRYEHHSRIIDGILEITDSNRARFETAVDEARVEVVSRRTIELPETEAFEQVTIRNPGRRFWQIFDS